MKDNSPSSIDSNGDLRRIHQDQGRAEMATVRNAFPAADCPAARITCKTKVRSFELRAETHLTKPGSLYKFVGDRSRFRQVAWRSSTVSRKVCHCDSGALRGRRNRYGLHATRGVVRESSTQFALLTPLRRHTGHRVILSLSSGRCTSRP